MNHVLSDGAAVPLPVPVLRAVVHGSGGDGRSGGIPQVDAAVLLLGAAGRAPSASDLVSVTRPQHPSGGAWQLPSRRHREGFMAAAEVALAQLDWSVQRVALAVSAQGGPLVAAGALQLTLWDTSGDTSLAVLPLAVESPTDTALLCGELHRNAARWEFRALRRGFPGGLPEMAGGYGLTSSPPSPPHLPPVPPPMPAHRPEPSAPQHDPEFVLPPQGPQFLTPPG